MTTDDGYDEYVACQSLYVMRYRWPLLAALHRRNKGLYLLWDVPFSPSREPGAHKAPGIDDEPRAWDDTDSNPAADLREAHKRGLEGAYDMYPDAWAGIYSEADVEAAQDQIEEPDIEHRETCTIAHPLACHDPRYKALPREDLRGL